MNLLTCNIEIGIISAVDRVSLEIVLIRCHLINTPLQRGGCGAGVPELFQQFPHIHKAAKPLKRL